MNGRIYDPTLGRFLQDDPHIQAPENSQSYNRYADVVNNPMSMTDPSGYFFKWVAKKLMGKSGARIVGFSHAGFIGAKSMAHAYGTVMRSDGLSGIANVALNFIPSCQVWCSVVFSADRAYYQTGSLSAAFHAGGRSAAVSGVFMGIGKAFTGAEGSWNVQGGAAHIAAHAVAGGVIADLQGGKFGHGFFAAGITKGFQASPYGSNNMVIGTVQSAIVGGTASAISGGKFANGAMTGAFQFLYNQCMSSGCSIENTFKRWGDMWGDASERMRNAFSKDVAKAGAALVTDVSVTVIVEAGGFAGYCPLAPCQAASWAGSSLDLLYNGKHGGTIGNIFSYSAGAYMNSRLHYIPTPLRNWGGAYIQGHISDVTSKHVNGE